MNRDITILLVEDQYFARLALRTVLGAQQGMCIVAETDKGSEAVELHRRHRPDVTIMDLRLPGLSGFDTMQAIQKDCRGAHILVLSNYEGSEDVHRALQCGALGYLTKDAGGGDLVEAVKAVHAGRRYLPAAVCRLLSEHLANSELTEREFEVLKLLTRGLSNRAIADELDIAEKTVKIHVGHILDKMGVTDRTQAAVTAIHRGIVHLD